MPSMRIHLRRALLGTIPRRSRPMREEPSASPKSGALLHTSLHAKHAHPPPQSTAWHHPPSRQGKHAGLLWANLIGSGRREPPVDRSWCGMPHRNNVARRATAPPSPQRRTTIEPCVASTRQAHTNDRSSGPPTTAHPLHSQHWHKPAEARPTRWADQGT